MDCDEGFGWTKDDFEKIEDAFDGIFPWFQCKRKAEDEVQIPTVETCMKRGKLILKRESLCNTQLNVLKTEVIEDIFRNIALRG